MAKKIEIRRPSTRWAYYLRSTHETGRIRCAYCGCELHHEHATLDHVIPTSKDGANEPSNVVVACGTCNRAKSDRPVVDFIRALAAAQAAEMAPHITPAGADDLDVAAIASEIEGELIREISARVRRERRRALNRKAGRASASLHKTLSRRVRPNRPVKAA